MIGFNLPERLHSDFGFSIVSMPRLDDRFHKNLDTAGPQTYVTQLGDLAHWLPSKPLPGPTEYSLPDT